MAVGKIVQIQGVVVDVEFCFKFDSPARFGDLGSERELCWVYLGTLPADAEITFNRTEIDAVRWVSPEELDRELTEQPRHFTPWLHLEWEKLRDRLLPSA